MKKKIVSVLLAIVMGVSLLPTVRLDAHAEAIARTYTWSELKDAMAAGGEIKLGGDVVASTDEEKATYLLVPEGKTVVLDLNGHTIDRGLTSAVGEGYVIKVRGSLTLNDSGTGGTITGGNDNGSGSNPSDIQYYGNIIRWGGGGIFVLYGTLTINGGTISGNTSAYGGGIHSLFSTFTMNGGNIRNNKADANISSSSIDRGCGGGIYIRSGPFTINGGTISDNEAIGVNGDDPYAVTGNGGGIWCTYSLLVHINGGTISGNTAIRGGGVYGTFAMDGGEISGNHAVYGGGIHTGGCDFGVINGGKIINNAASADGGGVYVDAVSTLGGVGSSPDKDGVYRRHPILTLKSGAISGNAARRGGGIFIGERDESQNSHQRIFSYIGAACVLEGCDITDNTASLGGGVFVGRIQDGSGGDFSGSPFSMPFGVSGAPNVTGNTNTTAQRADNVYLTQGQVITLVDEMTGGKVGVTTQVPPAGKTSVRIVKPRGFTPQYAYLDTTAYLPQCTLLFESDENHAIAYESDSIVMRLRSTGNEPIIEPSDTSEPSAPSGAANTTSTTNPDGSVTEVVTNPDGSKVETTTREDGSSSTIKTDAAGNTVSVAAKPSETQVSDAAKSGEAVILPVEVRAANDTESAVPIEITLPETDKPVKVEIPVENVKPGTVAVLVHDDGTKEIVKTSTTSENGVVLTLDGSATVKIVDNAKTFDDVPTGMWFSMTISWASSHEIMFGIGGGSFAPNGISSRGMVSQIIFNLDGATASGTTTAFSDVSPTDWFAGSVSWMVDHGIAQGRGGTFGANDAISREQLAVMYYNYAKYKGYDVNIRGDLSRFSDSGGVSSWARDALSWAVGVGLFNGSTDSTGKVVLNAQGSSTRGMVAAITQRFCENVVR